MKHSSKFVRTLIAAAILELSVLCVAEADQLEPPSIVQKNAISVLGSNPQLAGLRNLVSLVMANQPELKQAEAESRMADGRLKEARSSRLPQFAVNGGYGYEHQKIENRPAIIYDNQYQVQFKVTQPLLDEGIGANVKRVAATAMASDWQLVGVREQLMLRTIELLAEVVRQQQLTDIARDNLKLHRSYVAQMKDIARADVGRASDLPMAQARVALAESMLTSRLARLEAARVQWRAHSGMAVPNQETLGNGFQILVAGLELAPLPATLDEALTEATQNSPYMQKAMSEVKAAEHSQVLAKSATKPKINLEYQRRMGDNYGSVLGSQDNWSIGVNLQWALPFNPGFGHAERAALEARRVAEAGVDTTVLKIRSSVEAQWYELLANQASHSSYLTYVSSADQVVNAYAEQFKIGRRSLLDVLNAENELFTARSNALNAQTDSAVAAWRLLSLRGVMTQALGI